MALIWSYSMLESFETCPRKTYHKYVLKEKEPPQPHLEKGKRIHSALENAIARGLELPFDLRAYTPYVDSVKRMRENGAKVETEYKIAVTHNLSKADFWDASAWGRGVLDVLAIKGFNATIIDWKTGKKREKPDQMHISAAMVLASYAVHKVTAFNIWLEEGGPGTIYTFTDEPRYHLWESIRPRVDALREAELKKDWPERPSYACAWCPVHACPNNRNKGV